ncbi:MAG: class I SAM-dependent methyltransferase [Ilumatobacteraceae bacterium]
MEPNDFLRAQATKLPRGKVLSLGEGEGRNAVWLATQGFDVWSVDLSPVGVAKTLKLAKSHGVTVHASVGDLADYVIEPDTWDVIISIFAHTPPPIRRRIHQHVVRGLRHGGVYLLEAYTPKQIALGTGGPKDPSLMPTVELLADELSGLHFDLLHEVTRDVVEGSLHTGQAAVVQVVASRQYPDTEDEAPVVS